MSSYPCGKEIFKELVQNADHAVTTQINFIRDCRHHPTEKVRLVESANVFILNILLYE